MRNLDRVWAVWRDLDAAWLKSGISPCEYLRKLVANGDEEKVNATLARLAVDIETADDNKVFADVQERMVALVRNMDKVQPGITSPAEFVSGLTVRKTRTRASFEELERMVAIYQPYVVPSYSFDDSPVGIELIMKDSVHRVGLVSDRAVIVPVWAESSDQMPLCDNDFHNELKRQWSGDRQGKPCLLVKKGSKLDGKPTISGGTLVCGGIKVPVVEI